jgi:hypothetical protein
MIWGLSPRNQLARKKLLRQIDAAAADLNVVLIVVSIGLALLDLTFVVTQRVTERLPITRVIYDAPQSPTHCTFFVKE